MIQIDDTLVSLDVIERYFLCDLSKCKGECCVEGDSGAPLEDSELAKLQKVLPIIWDDLSPKAQEVIHKQGVAYIDEEGDTVTALAHLVSKGRKLHVWDVQINNSNGELISTVHVTNYIITPKEKKEKK